MNTKLFLSAMLAGLMLTAGAEARVRYAKRHYARMFNTNNHSRNSTYDAPVPFPYNAGLYDPLTSHAGSGGYFVAHDSRITSSEWLDTLISQAKKCFESGDRSKGKSFLKQATEQDGAEGCIKVAKFYHEYLHDDKKSFKLMKTAAKMGDAEAQYHTACNYYHAVENGPAGR